MLLYIRRYVQKFLRTHRWPRGLFFTSFFKIVYHGGKNISVYWECRRGGHPYPFSSNPIGCLRKILLILTFSAMAVFTIENLLKKWNVPNFIKHPNDTHKSLIKSVQAVFNCIIFSLICQILDCGMKTFFPIERRTGKQIMKWKQSPPTLSRFSNYSYLPNDCLYVYLLISLSVYLSFWLYVCLCILPRTKL